MKNVSLKHTAKKPRPYAFQISMNNVFRVKIFESTGCTANLCNVSNSRSVCWLELTISKRSAVGLLRRYFPTSPFSYIGDIIAGEGPIRLQTPRNGKMLGCDKRCHTLVSRLRR